MKSELRAQIRAARSGRAASADWVARVLARIPHGTVCAYVALPGEPPTEAIIEALLARGDDVFLPVAGEGLTWVRAADSRPWQAWGLRGAQCPVPAVELPEVDVILVPALAVDTRGRRLGQGGGYYDRFVPQHASAPTIALLWAGEVLPDVGAQAHDITVDEWLIADG